MNSDLSLLTFRIVLKVLSHLLPEGKYKYCTNNRDQKAELTFYPLLFTAKVALNYASVAT